MKHLLLTTIAAVLLVGCGESQKQVPSVKKSNPEADRALLKAALDGNIEAVRQHLATGADVNAKDKNAGGDTPLHTAIKSSRFRKEIVELLIAEGADVNAKDKYGRTPLHDAVTMDYKEVAELLIAKGASVNAQDVGGYTPLDSAIRWNYTEIADLLRKHGVKHGEKPVETYEDEFSIIVEDTDGDGVDDYDESLLGPDGKPIGDKDDSNVVPTREVLNEAYRLEAEAKK